METEDGEESVEKARGAMKELEMRGRGEVEKRAGERPTPNKASVTQNELSVIRLKLPHQALFYIVYIELPDRQRGYS